MRVPGFRDLKTWLLPDRFQATLDDSEDSKTVTATSVAAAALDWIPVVHSRFVLQSLYRLAQVLFPVNELEIESAVYDQRAGVLTVHVAQTVTPVLMPFYQPRVRAIVVLRLVQRTIDARGRILMPAIDGGQGQHQQAGAGVGYRTRLMVATQEDFMQPIELFKLLLPFVGGVGCMAMQLATTVTMLFLAIVVLPVAGLVPETVIRNGDGDSERRPCRDCQ